MQPAGPLKLEARSDLNQGCCCAQLVLHSHRKSTLLRNNPKIPQIRTFHPVFSPQAANLSPSGRVIPFKWRRLQGCFTFVDDVPDVGSLYWPGTFRIPLSSTGIRAALAQNISAAAETGERTMQCGVCVQSPLRLFKRGCRAGLLLSTDDGLPAGNVLLGFGPISYNLC